MKKKIITLGLLTLLVALSLLPVLNTSKENVSSTNEPSKTSDSFKANSLSISYTPHSAFILNASESSYTTKLASVVSGGDGTSGNPYIIEGYNFTTAVVVNATIPLLSSGIETKNISLGIVDVTDHIEIRNCWFSGSDLLNHSAVGIIDSSNITVYNNSISNIDGPAVVMIGCNDTRVENNELNLCGTDGFASILAIKSNRSLIANNDITLSSALMLFSVNHTVIRDNQLLNTVGLTIPLGLFLNGSHNAIVNNNFMSSGFIYIGSGNKGGFNINITNNEMIGTDAGTFFGAITIHGGGTILSSAGALTDIRIVNNSIEGTLGHGIQMVSGIAGLYGVLDITGNDLISNQGKGVDIDGNAVMITGLFIETNYILKNTLDGIYLANVAGSLILRNYIAQHNNPLYAPHLLMSPPWPSTGIFVESCSAGGIVIDSNAIHMNDYGIILYDFSTPNIGHIITSNLITYNHYYAIMITDLSGGVTPSIGNTIDLNDIYNNNFGGTAPPEGYAVPFLGGVTCQSYDEYTNYGAGNTWGGLGNYWSDWALMPWAPSYFIDYGMGLLPPYLGLPIGWEAGPVALASIYNLAPVITPMNKTNIIVAEGEEATLRWTLTDQNLNNVFNGRTAWGTWNGTDPNFLFATDDRTYLEISLKDLDDGNYSFDCNFDDTMDLSAISTLVVEIRENTAPVVATTNLSTYEFDEWDMNAKGNLTFTIRDSEWNLDTVVFSGNLSGASFLNFNGSDGLATIEIPKIFSAGVYTCTLTAIDTLGLRDSMTIILTINPNHSPVVFTTNESTYWFETTDLGVKGNLTFFINDEDDNLDKVNLTCDPDWNSTLSYTVSSGLATIEIPKNVTVGVYKCLVWVNDSLGLEHERAITVIVILENREPSVVADDSNMEMEIDDLGIIEWMTSDPDGNYATYVLTMDGKIIEQGVWTGGLIQIDLETLDLEEDEEYEFVLTCTDTFGRSDSDLITVAISEEKDKKETLSLWETMLEWIIGIIALIVAFFSGLLGLGIYLKRKTRDSCGCFGEPNCECSL